jgi:hypothetical protein
MRHIPAECPWQPDLPSCLLVGLQGRTFQRVNAPPLGWSKGVFILGFILPYLRETHEQTTNHARIEAFLRLEDLAW